MRLKRFAALVVPVLCSYALATAQIYDGSNGYADIRLDSSNVWLAETAGSYTSGGLRSASSGAEEWRMGVRAATVQHFDRISIAGSFGFEQLWGKSMAGSMLVRPGFFPVDIYEFTPGDKSRQTYSFDAGVCADIAPKWRIGVGMDLTTAHNVKADDLRHTSGMLDFAVKPGVQFHDGALAASASYIFSRSSESLSAEENPDLETFRDEGLYYGVRSSWSGGDVSLLEYVHGVCAKVRAGGFQANARWARHNGNSSFPQGVSHDFRGFDASFGCEYKYVGDALTHHAGVHLKVTGQDSCTPDVEDLFSRSTLYSDISYDFFGSGWNAGLVVGYVYKRGEVRDALTQSLRMPSFTLRGAKGVGPVKFALAASFSNGVMEDSEGASRLESYFLKYREHMTSDKITLIPSVRYSFCGKLYAEIMANWQHGFRLEYLGADRCCTAIKLGCKF